MKDRQPVALALMCCCSSIQAGKKNKACKLPQAIISTAKMTVDCSNKPLLQTAVMMTDKRAALEKQVMYKLTYTELRLQATKIKMMMAVMLPESNGICGQE